MECSLFRGGKSVEIQQSNEAFPIDELGLTEKFKKTPHERLQNLPLRKDLTGRQRSNRRLLTVLGKIE